MKIIYIVTDGEYSDYHICGVYSSKKLAEELQNLYTERGDVPSIEEWELNNIPKHPLAHLFFEVEMDRKGNVAEVYRQSVEYSSDEKWEPYGDADKQWVVFAVWAKDETHAIKIANEHRVQLIANGEWTSDWEEWRKRKEEEK